MWGFFYSAFIFWSAQYTRMLRTNIQDDEWRNKRWGFKCAPTGEKIRIQWKLLWQMIAEDMNKKATLHRQQTARTVWSVLHLRFGSAKTTTTRVAAIFVTQCLLVAGLHMSTGIFFIHAIRIISEHSVPTILILELWIRKHALSKMYSLS